ncbi:hypothetical protein BGM26_07120 [Bacillus sp. FJAT-29790]|uniref:hypothetical protein n=1 Tax=Bacillus sp. FJAT-29790 TaxID=1895002 RepID=UPI001C234AA6|nr:hypothetical protein [Bacillus sp. FJAT-29790]MBU8878761.1 hypothetical protein [Bacillus sp. FJAT-29790]
MDEINLSIFDISNLLSKRNGVASLASSAAGITLSNIYGGDLHVWFALALVLAISFDWFGIAASKKELGYVLIQVSPLILNVLKQAGNAV